MKKKAGQWWEGICNKCGLCCREKEIYGSLTVIKMDSCCQFYQCESGNCSVYNERFEKEPRCIRMTLRRVLFARWLPSECAYRQKLCPWKGLFRKTIREYGEI